MSETFRSSSAQSQASIYRPYGSFLPSFAFSFLFCDKYAVFFRMKHYYLRKSFSTSLFLLYLQMNNKGS